MQFVNKYRPRSLFEIVGNKITVQEFKNRSKTKDFPQVMLFSGLSGSGKTTSAFIVAKFLNCKTPIKKRDGTFEPCNQCASCKDVNEEKFYRDIIFKDASTMGKEEVLKLEDDATSSPMYDENRVIIIDEAQLLTSSGKGATLKLLEKPRKGVYFILCTMEEEALIKAMKSRCQVYKFKEVGQNDIADFLVSILKKEELFEKVPEEFLTTGLFTLAESSGGSVREAVQYLERCIYSNIFDNEKIINELGLVSTEITGNILEKLLNDDSTVFKDIKNIDCKEFYYKSLKILTEAYIYGKTKFIDQPWKIKNAERLIRREDKLNSLLRCLNKVDTNPYFKESSLMFNLIQYFYGES